jgi:DNA topoisomerase-1
MVASQMSKALFKVSTADIRAKHPRLEGSESTYLLRASSTINTFPGFTILYSEGKDEDEKEYKQGLPELVKDEELKLLDLSQEQHSTQPPPNFNEATLVKALEQWGIGRPSTYAPILSTLQEREYVVKNKSFFQPTELGIVVNDLLSQHFPEIVNVEFTARMEEELDEIAQQNRDWVEVIRNFYNPFEKSLKTATQLMTKVILDEPTDETCPRCGKLMLIKLGRYGKFVACSGYPECKYTRSFEFKIGIQCPECGGDLVKRINKKRHFTFYACNLYPECHFFSNLKPLPQHCPKCNGLLATYRVKWAKCIKCGYKEKIEEDMDAGNI